jgi:hypothetical protein
MISAVGDPDEGPHAPAKNRVGDRAAGEGYQQPDRLVKQDSGDRRVVGGAVDDQHPRDPADRPGTGRQRNRSAQGADDLRHDHDGEPWDRVGMDGEKGGPQDEHVKTEVGDDPEHTRPASAVGQQLLCVIDGVGERAQRARDLGVLGVKVVGIADGATGDQQRGCDPGRCSGCRRRIRAGCRSASP